jgi:hypothetical protein
MRSKKSPGVFDLADPGDASSGAAIRDGEGQQSSESRARPTCLLASRRPQMDRPRSQGRSRSQGRGSVGQPCQGGVWRVLQASGGICRSTSHAHTRHEGRVYLGHVHPGTGRKSGGAARSGFLHDAAGRELPAHDRLRQGRGVPVLCRKQRNVRSQTGGGKGTREEVTLQTALASSNDK